jgi:hypothetical protein
MRLERTLQLFSIEQPPQFCEVHRLTLLKRLLT